MHQVQVFVGRFCGSRLSGRAIYPLVPVFWSWYVPLKGRLEVLTLYQPIVPPE